MATAVESAEGLLASKAGRGLAFACSFTVCLLAACVLAITLWGRPRGPAISLDLPESAGGASKIAAPVSAGLSEGAVTGPVTKSVFAGKVLLADPALIQN